MFELNAAVSRWRDRLHQGDMMQGEELDELEDHLRDEVDQLVRSGLPAEEAF